MKDCDQVLVEHLETGLVQSLLDSARYPKGESLSDHLGKSTRQALQQVLSAQGVPRLVAHRYRPWSLVLMAASREMAQRGYPGRALRKHVRTLAAGIRTRPLLDPGNTISFLDGLTDEEQGAMIRVYLSDPDWFERVLASWRSAWCKGDEETLEKSVVDSLATLGSEAAGWTQWIEAGNQEIARRIGEELKEGKNSFILLGAACLFGDKGVLAQLKARGIEVSHP